MTASEIVCFVSLLTQSVAWFVSDYTYKQTLQRIGRNGGSEKILGEWFRISKDDSEDKWMPIDTAPKDGSMILVYEKGSISSKRWFPEYSDWAHEFPGIAGNSHWMPLPPAPGEEKGGV